MLDIGGIQPTKSRKLAADIRVRLQQYREYIWKQRTHTKNGAEMEHENATKDPARYNEPFTPLRNPTRHDQVQKPSQTTLQMRHLNGTKSYIELQPR
jgi:hypothetical protein